MPFAKSSAGAPLWAVIVAVVVVIVALYLLLGARRIPFLRIARGEEAEAKDDGAPPA
jgi:hypothetical protein